MLSRFYLLYLLVFLPGLGFADNANWNCNQDSKTKAWNCVGTSASPEKPAEKQASRQNGKSKELVEKKSSELPIETTEIKKTEIPARKDQGLNVEFDSQ